MEIRKYQMGQFSSRQSVPRTKPLNNQSLPVGNFNAGNNAPMALMSMA